MTYEYVVAMRSQSEPPGVAVEGDARSIPSSPSGSTAIGLSGGSSLGLQYKGAWCTPLRILLSIRYINLLSTISNLGLRL